MILSFLPRFAALLGLGLAIAAGQAVAQVTEIYKCVDDKGRPLYTSDKRDTAGKKCELVSREVMVVPAPATGRPGGSKSATPKSFPRESTASRSEAREKQRQILERELEQERELLAKAKRALGEQEAVRTGDERNYAKVLARLQPYKDSVEVHQKNVEALERELKALYR